MRVLEISRLGLLKALLPDDTDWIRWGTSLTVDEPISPELFSLSLLARTLSQIGRREFDLIVLPAIHPQHVKDQSSYKVLSKAMLRGIARVPVLPSLLFRLGLRSARSVVLDIHDDRRLCDTSLRLFAGCNLYFKRELALDIDQAGPWAGKIRPLSLVLPDENRIPAPRQKDIDLVFAGALCSDARCKAIAEARALAAQGVRVLIPEKPLPYPAFMEILARSWLVLSPEGQGWDCYRHYEACLAGSVPLINRPRYRRHLYLQEGRHCFYYDADRDGIAPRVLELLGDRQSLARISAEGRRHVLANHTRSAVGRYILSELEASSLARLPSGADAPLWRG